ncbi:hypothetical protein DFJ77DRAFT_285603 [Powellomyces hirtus]|nr:hypothetical protein DFJ77DRAFT_285603 [Powellomyces hirtus]
MEVKCPTHGFHSKCAAPWDHFLEFTFCGANFRWGPRETCTVDAANAFERCWLWGSVTVANAINRGPWKFHYCYPFAATYHCLRSSIHDAVITIYFPHRLLLLLCATYGRTVAPVSHGVFPLLALESRFFAELFAATCCCWPLSDQARYCVTLSPSPHISHHAIPATIEGALRFQFAYTCAADLFPMCTNPIPITPPPDSRQSHLTLTKSSLNEKTPFLPTTYLIHVFISEFQSSTHSSNFPRRALVDPVSIITSNSRWCRFLYLRLYVAFKEQQSVAGDCHTLLLTIPCYSTSDAVFSLPGHMQTYVPCADKQTAVVP